MPSGVDVGFLRGFRKLIVKLSGKGFRFVVVCGGGRVCRDYQRAAGEVVGLRKDDLDWIGVASTRLNAELLRVALHDVAYREVINNPGRDVDFREKVLVAAGWKPGWSTDYVSAFLARKFGVGTIVNLTNKDFVYDRNPDEHRDAKPLSKISWDEFRKMFGSEWSPGLNVPFDPVASRFAHESGIGVVVVGKNLMNLESFLLGKKFKGTVIG